MTDTVIRVDNLSKKYILSHQKQERYTTLRDSIANGAKGLLKPFQGKKKSAVLDADSEEFWALKDVSFEIKQGDRIGIIGRNGAGKSTLLKILSRIVEPTQGKIGIKGRVASLLEVGTGFHPELTGRENIYLNGAILGMSKGEIRRKFDEIVAFAEVDKFLDTPVKRYSSGMYVRLAFAVAAHLEPEILIVDEVLAVGDSVFQKKCLGKMEDVGKEGRTVLFVSHNMGAIKKLCDRLIYLKSGQVEQIGETDEIVQKYLSNSSNSVSSIDSNRQILVEDPEIDVFDFYACTENGERREVFATAEYICFVFKYQIKSIIPKLRVGIDFYSYLTGDVLFRSFDDDMVLLNREPASIEAICKIPVNLLKPGLYGASLQIGIHNVRWITDNKIVKQISVEAVDGVNSNYSDYRPGIIMPQLQWDVKSIPAERIERDETVGNSVLCSE